MDNFNGNNNVSNGNPNNFGQPVTNGQNEFDGSNQIANNGQNAFDGSNQIANNGQNAFGGFGQPGNDGQNAFGGFGQPGNDGQNPFGGVGDGVQGFGAGFGNQPVTPSKPPKKPMSKGAKIGLFGGIAALIVLIVCAVIFVPKLIKSPKDKVVDAYNNTFNAGKSSSDSDKFNTEGGTFKINISAEDGLSALQLNGYEIALEGASDIASESSKCKLALNYNNDEVISFDVIVNPSNIYFTSEQLIDGYVVIPGLENIDELKTFLQNNNVDEEVLNMIDQLNNNTATGTANVDSAIVDDINKATDKLSDAVVVEKKGKKGITVCGESITAMEYEVTLKKEDVSAYVKEIVNVVLDQPETAAQLEEEGVSKDMVTSAVEMFIQNDFKMQVYVKDNKLVKATSEDVINVFGATGFAYKFNVEVNDKDLNFVAEITAEGTSIGVSGDIKDYSNMPNGIIKAYADAEAIEIVVSSDSADSCNLELKYNGTSYVKLSVQQTAGAPGKIEADASKKTYEIVKMSQNDLMTIVTDNQDKINNFFNEIVQKGGPLVQSIMGGNNSIDNLEPQDDPQNDPQNAPQDDSDKDAKNNSQDEEMLLVSIEEETKVRILGSLDGYKMNYSCEYFIDFINDERTVIEYYLEDYATEDEFINSITCMSEDIVGKPVSDEKSTVKVDNSDAFVRAISYDSDGAKLAEIYYAKKVANGTILVVKITDYSGDVSSDKIAGYANAISDKYYKVEN